MIPKFAVGAPPGSSTAGSSSARRFPTGTPPARRSRPGHGNALVARRPLMALPGPFDERYNFTGGEDGDVFARLIDAGCRFIAVDSAIVYEHLTPRRTTMRWLLRRRVRTGIDQSRLTAPARRRDGGACGVRARSQGRSSEGLVGLLLFPVARASGFAPPATRSRHIGTSMFLNGLTCRPYLEDSWR